MLSLLKKLSPSPTVCAMLMLSGSAFPNIAGAINTTGTSPASADAVAAQEWSGNFYNGAYNPGTYVDGVGSSGPLSSTLNGPAGGPALSLSDQLGTNWENESQGLTQLIYYVTYTGPGPVTINMSDALSAVSEGFAESEQVQATFSLGVAIDPHNPPPGGGGAYALGEISPTGVIWHNAGEPVYINNLSSSLLYNLTDCASSFGSGNTCIGNPQGSSDFYSAQPLQTLTNVQLQSGVTYVVDLSLAYSAEGGLVTGEFDPTFSAASGSFSFSPGVVNNVSAVPEPAAAWLTIPGALLAWGARSRTQGRKRSA